MIEKLPASFVTMTLREAATALRIHERTARDLVRDGKLKGRLVGRRWRFTPDDLAAFFKAQPGEWSPKK